MLNNAQLMNLCQRLDAAERELAVILSRLDELEARLLRSLAQVTEVRLQLRDQVSPPIRRLCGGEPTQNEPPPL